MTDVLALVAGPLAEAVAAAALLAGAVALVSTRRPALALSVFLDMLLAAGLLRLAGDPSWQMILTAAVLIALRRLIGVGLRAGGRAWTMPERSGQENSAL